MRKLLIGLALALAGETAIAADAPCAKVDPLKKDKDGIPFCPDVVKQTTAYAVFGCAIHQSTSWHEPSKAEVQNGRALLDAFKAKNYPALLASADKLKAQVCRVVDGDDKYLLVYAKPGVKDYIAPSFILRDAAKVSKLILVAPHMTSDGYFAAAPKALQNSRAVIGYYSGHLKSLGQGRDADFSHSKKDLGYNLIKYGSELYPKHAWLHAHGMASTGHVLYRPLKGPLAKPYEAAIKKFTNIERFEGFNSYYEIDSAITAHTGYYVKTEIPAKTYRNNSEILAKIFTYWETTYKWAWDDMPEPSPEPEPTYSPIPDEEVEVEEPDQGDEDPTLEEERGEETVETEPTPVVEPIQWKPQQKPKLGKQDLICVAVQYTSGPSATVEKCKSTANSVASFYKRQARGKFELIPQAISYSFDGPANGANAAKVHDIMRKKYPKALFMFPNLWYKGSSHAGMRVAVLTGYSNGSHEVGHLLGLGHCGAIRDGNMEAYGGSGCIMSRFFSNAALFPSQHVWLGWLNPDQYAVYGGVGVKEYELRKSSKFDGKGLATIALPPALWGDKDARPGWIDYSNRCQKDPCLAFYRSNGGGAQRYAIFGKEYKDEASGLVITKLGGDSSKVRLSVEVVSR